MSVRSLSLKLRSLSALASLLLFPALLAHAQDTRTVNEPAFPATCTALAATQSIASGEPTSETAFDTSRIQSALNACGSGKAVELTPGGTNNVYNAFLIAPITIPNGVTLIVDGGVTVFASRNPADYQVSTAGVETCGTVGTAGNGCIPLITVNSNATSTGAGIMGFGIINARGGDKLLVNGVTQTYSWWDQAAAANTGSNAQNNPILLFPKKASNFTLYKITLMNSPMFHVKYQSGSGFTVWGTKIVTPYNARNTDGIDIDDSVSNVTINNAYISDGDDNVAPGATSGNPVSNISILNTHTFSGHGVSIGSYTAGGVSNMYVNNVNMSGNLSDTNSGGLKIKSASDRGGVVNNISYNNVCIQNIRYPLQFNPIYNTNTGTSFPSFTNIGLHSVTAAAINGSQIQLQGLNANFPLGLTMDNLDVTGTFTLTPASHYTNFTLGPGPVLPTTLQQLNGANYPGNTYTGVITNPAEAVHACPSANFPFLAGELYLSTTTLNNQKTLSLAQGASFTLNATLQIVESSSTTPTQPVVFYEGTTQLGAGTLSSNGTLASLTLSNVTSGAHTYTAKYSVAPYADSAYATLSFGSVTVNVNTTATTTSMTASPTTATYGAGVLLTATVVQGSGSTVPGGTVNFQSGSTLIGTGTLNSSGVATYTATALPVGNNPIAAYYQGSTNFATSDSSATPVTVQITQAGTTASVGASPSPAAYGASITLSSTVTSATSGTPTGTVTFMDGSTTVGSAVLSSGTATLATTSLAAGIHHITAVYGGDTNFTSSTSASSATETITTASTTTSLGYTSGSSPYGSAVTMIGTISNGTATGASGSITFTDTSTSTQLAQVTIAANASSASYTTSTLAIGTHNIVATYSGDGNYTGSGSASTPLVITQAGSTAMLSTTNATPTYGTNDSFTATIAATTTGTPTGTVTFMDGSSPIGTTQTLSGGTAGISLSTLLGGSHSITAVYSGDSNYSGSTSSVLTVTVGAAGTTLAVSGSPSVQVYGSAVALTATLTPSVSGVAASGSVKFYDGATLLGSGTLSSNTATLNTSSLTGGSHSLTAVYSGDGNYATSTAASFSETINKANTTSAVSANPTSIVYGGSTTLTATVSPSTATGSFTFFFNGASLGTGTISAGTATLATRALPAGTDPVTATYSGDTNYATSSTTTAASVIVTQAGSTTIASANPTTITYGASTTLSATVTTGATGSVTFKDGANTLGAGTLSAGVATFIANTLAGGSHSITAVYGGDANFTSSTSSATTVQVNTASDGVSVSANPTTFAYGSATLLTATLTNTAGTGSVTFKDGANTLGTGTIASGVATFNATSLAGGSHSITAVYSGDTNFSTSTSTAIIVTVNLATTTTGISANPSLITFGASTSLSATVSSTAATGTVTFRDGSAIIGTGTVTNGIATATAAALAGGSHSITATYSGDSNFATSTSTATTVTVNTAATSTSVSANPATTTFGSSVVLTASILPNGSTAETGTVTFKDGGTTLGTSPVANGSASLSISTFATTTHSITVVYSGDTNYTTSTSAAITVTINPVTPTVALSASPSSITFGSPTTITATLTPATASGTVTFKDGSTTLGTGTIASGAASLTVSTLTGGSHSITAVYSGDTNDTTATSAATTVSVGLLSTTTTAGATPSTITYGTSTTLNASVSPASATGSFTFKDGATILGTVTAASGAATLPVANLTTGSHSITAVYSGDTNNATSTSTAITVTVNQASASATISATPANASYGTATSITVTVTPSTATGTITFKDGATTLGTASLTSGTASFAATLAAGTHTLSASYAGDTNYTATSTTVSASVVIAVANSSVVASANPSTVPLGSSTTVSASVTPAAATGTVTFRDTGTGIVLGTGTITGGTASVSGVVLSPAGTHTVTATYSGDTNDAASTSAAANIAIAPGSSTTSLTLAPVSPAVYGTSLTFSTTNTTVLGIAPTGTVSFYDASTLLGSAPIALNSGGVPASSFTYSQLMPGTHSLTAKYSGDANYATTTSAPVTFVVGQSNSTVTLTSSPTQAVINQTYTLTATAASGTSTGTPTGSVNFYNSSNVSLGTVALVNGAASITQSQPAVGSFSYTATYSGDVDFTTSSTTAPITVLVKQLASTSSISATPISGTFGSGTYSVTAVVTPAAGGPATGTVIFKDGATILGTVTLPSSGSATLQNIALTGGVHTIVAYYSGDPTYTSSDTTAAPALITVSTAASATGLSASPATSSVGTSVTFTASVTSTTGTAATGTITFKNGTAVLGTGILNVSGVAGFTTSSLPIATYNVTAVYSGDTNFAASTSAVSVVTVTQTPQTITLTGVPASATYGAAPFTVSASASSNLPVTLTVSGPASLSGSTVTIIGTGTVTVTANQAGNTTYAAAPAVSSSDIVAKAPLTVTVANQSIAYGAALPTYTGSVSGQVNGDTITATYSSTATATSAPGTYPITATLSDPGSKLGNYTVANPGGTLTIAAASQTITFPALTQSVTYGVGSMTVAATSSSSLAVTYTVSGPATLTGSTLAITGAGSVVITANQAGNASYAAATPVMQTITVAKAPLTITSANASRTYGGANPNFTGSVTGIVNGDAVSATYSSTATSNSAVGTYPITVTVVDPNSRIGNYAVTSTAGTLTITAAATTTTLTSTAAQIYANSPVTFTATVASTPGAPATGSVTFLNGSATLGTSTVTNGVATLALSNLTAGAYSVTASFTASGNYAASVSSATVLTVVSPVALTLTPTSISLAAGAAGSSSMTVTPALGFTGSVTLGCSSPVAYITCTVTSPVTITGTTPASATININVAATAALQYPRLRSNANAAALAGLLPFAGLLLIPVIRRRKQLMRHSGIRLLALLLMAVGASFAVTGCGSSGSISGPALPPAGSQSVTITATANGAATTTILTVNVTN